MGRKMKAHRGIPVMYSFKDFIHRNFIMKYYPKYALLNFNTRVFAGRENQKDEFYCELCL